MKFLINNPTLAIAFVLSVVAHGILLALHFTAPDAEKTKPADPALEVILVNAKHDKAPMQADVLAQANLDGGGNADAGRATSPLPDLGRVENGDNVRSASHRVEELEAQQRKLMEQIDKATSFQTPSTDIKDKTQPSPPQPKGVDLVESAKEIARREAEIAKRIEDYNKRPRKAQLTPSTREVGYALYYRSLAERIEKLGTLNFPNHNGRKLYGELIVSIPLSQDGTIYDKEGGPRVERSSGNAELDRAAVRITRRAAPFGKFPPNMRTIDVWEVIVRFNFTREEGLEAEVRSGG